MNVIRLRSFERSKPHIRIVILNLLLNPAAIPKQSGIKDAANLNRKFLDDCDGLNT